MRIRTIMYDNRDTTVWGGVSLLLALTISPGFWEQVGIVVLGPTAGWLLLHYTKKLIAWWESDDNNQ